MTENIECGLIFDEMSIRQAKLWKGKKNVGCVDLGDGNINKDTKASKVFVFMLVCLSENWKIPVGYFLVHALTHEMISNSINICLEKCNSVGVNVRTLTFDGCPTNIKAVNHLGCNLSKNGDLKTVFTHPTTNEDVVVLLDACHMIKLIRNIFENKKVIFNGLGQKIQWALIKKLHKLQEENSLHFGNKITKRHIFFRNQIMKVSLATQTLSRSVADAIKLCDQVLKSRQFSDSGPTVEFITIMNDIFDVLNSRAFNKTGFQKAISAHNKNSIFEFIDRAVEYIKSLKIYSKVKRIIKKKNRQPRYVIKIQKKYVLDSQSKIGFLGFIVCLQSLKILYHNLVETQSKLKYIATYRLSQDHLELFFSMIRKHGGFNNNPNAVQFKGAYRRALNHLSLKSGFTGNAVPLDNFPILTVSSVKTINSTIAGARHEEETSTSDRSSTDSSVEIDHDYISLLDKNISNLSEDIELIVGYIAGWVVRGITKKLKCETCITSLLSDEKLRFHKLIQIKNMGGLCFPSNDAYEVCLQTEKSLRNLTRPSFSQKSDTQRLIALTLKTFIGKDTFSVLSKHSLDQPTTDNHRLHLIRALIEKYLNCRMHYECKIENNDRTSKRQKFTKLIQFEGQ